MSQETIEWLNENVLVGFVEEREKWAGQPFSIKQGEQWLPWFAHPDYEHAYEADVPMEALEKLFGWEALQRPSITTFPLPEGMTLMEADGVGPDGKPFIYITDPDRQQIVRSDNRFIMNVRKKDYEPHQYMEWLIGNVAKILDDDVQVGSAGLLRGGGAAWVSCELPETIQVEIAGYPIRTRILSFTSHDSLYQTTYLLAKENPLCDNSLTGEIRRDGSDSRRQFKQKHTRGSGLQIADAKEALTILYKAAEEDVAFFEELAKWEVAPKQFASMLNLLEPIPEAKTRSTPTGKSVITNQRAINAADQRRTDIATIYARDPRAAKWKGTALGVYQTFNTFDQHHRSITDEAARFGRTMHETLTGKVAEQDRKVLTTLAAVTDRKDLVFA